MSVREGTALFGQLPISEFGALRESRALEPVMRPTCTVFIHPLSAAREYFGTVCIAQMQCVRGGVMHLGCDGSVGVLSQIPQYRLNEFVVCRNRQVLPPRASLTVVWSIAPILP